MSATELTHYGPAPVDENGALSCLVQQVSDSSPMYDMTQRTYSVKYKGPYLRVKDLPRVMVGESLTYALLHCGMTVVSRIPHPVLGEKEFWMIKSASVEEREAGDHAILTLKCDTSNSSGSTEGEEDLWSNTWNLRWESYTMKPYAFSANAGSGFPLTTPLDQIDLDIEQQQSSRERVEMFLNGKDHGMKDGQYWYRDDQGEGWWLNHKDKLLLKKVLEDKSALYHYPVMTHTTVKNFKGDLSTVLSTKIKYGGEIGDGIDRILLANDSNLSGCPYDFPENTWTWIKTGDDMTHTKIKRDSTVQFQRVETFMGVISADENYYGNISYLPAFPEITRWAPGKL